MPTLRVTVFRPKPELSTEYETLPRPLVGWAVFVLSMLVRAWALPFFVVGWIVGNLVGALTVGFVFAWEMPELLLSKKLREGQFKREAPKIEPDWDDEVEDEP